MPEAVTGTINRFVWLKIFKNGEPYPYLINFDKVVFIYRTKDDGLDRYRLILESPIIGADKHADFLYGRSGVGEENARSLASIGIIL